MLEASTRKPRESRVVFSVCSRARYTRNPSLDIYLLSVYKIQHISSLFQDPDDLPFRKGEVLTVVSKDEEQWWTARNALGQTGSIPVPYIAKVSNEKK